MDLKSSKTYCYIPIFSKKSKISNRTVCDATDEIADGFVSVEQLLYLIVGDPGVVNFEGVYTESYTRFEK